jgi:hypothetical protein
MMEHTIDYHTLIVAYTDDFGLSVSALDFQHVDTAKVNAVLY